MLDAQLRLQYSRSSGPGGQNVNKVNTRAELWAPIEHMMGLPERARQRLASLAGSRLTQAGEIHLSSDTERSQDANREAVFERLRELIMQALSEPRRRRKTKPTQGSKRRRLDGKRRRSDVKQNRRDVGPE